jgi:hypothetical protein
MNINCSIEDKWEKQISRLCDIKKKALTIKPEPFISLPSPALPGSGSMGMFSG